MLAPAFYLWNFGLNIFAGISVINFLKLTSYSRLYFLVCKLV